MIIEKGYIFNLETKEYIIVSTIKYNGVDYGFVNEINKKGAEEEKYHIIYIENGNLTFLNDVELANKLIPLFQEEIKKDLKENNLL